MSEIIEIGLCTVDARTLQRLEKRAIMVKPIRSTVSEFCTRLTTLRQDDVHYAGSLPDAVSILKKEYRSLERLWASWGDYDRNQFARECTRDGIPYPFGDSHANVRVRFTKALGLSRRPGMDAALKLAGLPLEGVHHRGADDAWNIAALAIELARRGQPITSP